MEQAAGSVEVTFLCVRIQIIEHEPKQKNILALTQKY